MDVFMKNKELSLAYKYMYFTELSNMKHVDQLKGFPWMHLLKYTCIIFPKHKVSYMEIPWFYPIIKSKQKISLLIRDKFQAPKSMSIICKGILCSH